MEEHIITWRGIQVEITFTPEKFGVIEHIELHSENRLALPVTETGYRSHFIPIGSVEQEGGPLPMSPHGWTLRRSGPAGAARSYHCFRKAEKSRLAAGPAASGLSPLV